MKLAKILFIIILINILQFFVSSCCNPGFYFAIDGMFIEVLKGDDPTSDLKIERQEFGLKANILNEKYTVKTARAGNNAMAAYDCWPCYEHDSITYIRVKTVDPVQNIVTDVSDEFYVGFYPDGSTDLEQFVDHLSDLYFSELYLCPSDPNAIVGKSRFIIEIGLYKLTPLTDTTNVIEIF